MDILKDKVKPIKSSLKNSTRAVYILIKKFKKKLKKIPRVTFSLVKEA